VIASPLLTARDVARLLSVHPNTVYALATSGQIASVVVGANRRRFRAEDVEAYVLANREGGE